MDAITNTELAILGLVAEYPRYGYQIEQDIAERGMRNWTEVGFSSIYYVLSRLEAGGWLSSKRVVGTSGTSFAYRRESESAAVESGSDTSFGLASERTASLEGTAGSEQNPGAKQNAGSRRAGPARKVYHLTTAGREGLRAAVLDRLSRPRSRTGDFDLALANLPVLTPDEVRNALQTYHTDLLQRLTFVRAKLAQDRTVAAQANQPFPPHVDALFEHSIAMIEAEAEWVGRYIHQLVISSSASREE